MSGPFAAGRKGRAGEEEKGREMEPVLVGFLLCYSDSIWAPVCGVVLSSPLDTEVR